MENALSKWKFCFLGNSNGTLHTCAAIHVRLLIIFTIYIGTCWHGKLCCQTYELCYYAHVSVFQADASVLWTGSVMVNMIIFFHSTQMYSLNLQQYILYTNDCEVDDEPYLFLIIHRYLNQHPGEAFAMLQVFFHCLQLIFGVSFLSPTVLHPWSQLSYKLDQ